MLTPSSPRSGSGTTEANDARELDDFFSAQDPIDVTAADWHTRSEQGLTPHEQAELHGWLAQDPAHAAAFESLAVDAMLLRRIPAARTSWQRDTGACARRPIAAATAPVPIRPTAASATRAWRPAHFALTVAAMLALLVAAGGAWWWQQPLLDVRYAVGRVERHTVDLPDGSTLSLDAQSQVDFTLYRGRREARLVQGQALFSVRPDSSRPFDVLAGPARVTVVGTRFSVGHGASAGPAGDIQVAVEEGRVTVRGDAGGMPGLARGCVELAAGQALLISARGHIGEVSPVLPGAVAPWARGMVRFDATPLAQALQAFERYGDTGLIVDPRVAALTVGGSFKSNDPAAFARMLPRMLPVRLLPRPGGIVVIAPAP